MLGRIACTLFLIGALTSSLVVDGAAQSRRNQSSKARSETKGSGATAQQAIGAGLQIELDDAWLRVALP